MHIVYEFIISNIYLYICIIISLLILTTILLTITANQRRRRKIKNDFVVAERVEAELENIEDTQKSSTLEDIIKKMQEDIDVKPEDVVKKFEQEQEENAIISYQELLDNVKSGKIEVLDDEVSDVNYVEGITGEIENEPIMAMETVDADVTPEMVKEAIENISKDCVKIEPKKFKQSEVISPVFGIINSNLEYPTLKKNNNVLDLMNTKDYNKLTEEIKKQEEFLNALKEFRNNL